MKLVLNRKQMQEMDHQTIHDFGIPSQVLMESAGAKCAEAIHTAYPLPTQDSVLVLCGSGNNGGDGYVMARHLNDISESLLIISLGAGPASEESRLNRELCQKLGIEILDIPDEEAWLQTDMWAQDRIGVMVDAVFGIGFCGQMPDYISDVIQELRAKAEIAVAIDIPSGADADNGTGFVYRADMCLAIEEYKYGHFLNDAPFYCGKLQCIKIGIPAIYKTAIDSVLMEEIIFPKRYADAHKGTYGRVFIIGGSPGYVGSVRLAARAALRSGAGLVHICSRKEILDHYAAFADEVINFAIPEGIDSMPDSEELQALLNAADAIAIGSGMGVDAYATELLKIVLTHTRCPLVIDADAITLLSRNPGLRALLKDRECVLTPHLGEFCRLAGITMDELKQNSIEAVSALQRDLNCNILLKGHSTVFCGTDDLCIVRAGNDALATGGSGDLLTGIIASFLAQKLPLAIAAPSAALLMGKTAERLSRERHNYGILPNDVIEHLGDRYV